MVPPHPEGRRLPLYASFQAASLATTGGNLGLLYDKFFDRWTQEWRIGGKEKTGWLRSLAQLAGTSCCRDLLAEWQERTRALVRARGGRMGVFRTVERFVSGTGRTHPVENGFSFHHTLGVPYLPGSGLKGVTRSWAGSQADRLFGTCDRAGAVDVLDALPLKPPCLVVEVLTPHYGGWTPGDPPGDWRSPVPVPYLAVEAGMELVLALVGRGAGREEGEIGKAWALLVEAVATLGAGARTALGFGRLELVNELPLSDPAISAEPKPGGLESARPATGAGRWKKELEGRGDQEVYERVRQALRSGEADPDLPATLDALGYLSAWREGRKRGMETTGARKLRELAAQLKALSAQGGGGNGGG